MSGVDESGPEGSIVSRARDAWDVANQAYWRLNDDDGLPLSGNIAFSIILSAFPFLILLTALAGFVGDTGLAVRAVRALLDFAPPEVVDPLRSEIFAILTKKQQGILTFSLVITVWTASSGIKSIRTGLNRAYGLQDTRSFWLLGLLDIVFVILGSIGMLSIAGLLVVGPLAWDALERELPPLVDFRRAFHLLRLPVFIAIAGAILLFAHKWLPARSMKLRHLVPGIAITLAIWTIGAWGYGLYVGNFANYASTYAGLAGIAIALMFLYLSGAVLLFGAEINQVLSIRRAARRTMGETD